MHVRTHARTRTHTRMHRADMMSDEVLRTLPFGLTVGIGEEKEAEEEQARTGRVHHGICRHMHAVSSVSSVPHCATGRQEQAFTTCREEIRTHKKVSCLVFQSQNDVLHAHKYTQRHTHTHTHSHTPSRPSPPHSISTKQPASVSRCGCLKFFIVIKNQIRSRL